MATHTAAPAVAEAASTTSWVPLAIIVLAQLQMGININALPVSIGGIVAEFNVAPTTVGTAIVAYSLGVAGFIIPDLPYEESADLRAALDRVGLALVQMVTPVTPAERLKMLCEASQGFVYAVTMTGTTGRNVAVPDDVLIEHFIHGALCVSWSGQCLTSEAWGGRSANRGQCAQSCRMPYDLVVDGERRDLRGRMKREARRWVT